MDLPKALVDAARSRRLLPIIGAGFTKNVNRDIPDWGQVIDIAAKDLNYDPEIMRLHGDYLQIAEYYDRCKHGIDELTYKLSQLIDSDKFDVGLSTPHLLLPLLDTLAIYTTNWDSWIEKGFQKAGFPYHKVVIPDHLASTDLLHPAFSSDSSPFSSTPTTKSHYPITQIIKFHGDFSRPDTIVVKQSDYFRRLNFEDPLDIRLRADIIGRSVLFIGYSFADLNIRYLWYRLIKMMAAAVGMTKSFLITPNPNPILERILEDQSIELVLLDSRNITESLSNVLQTLIEAQEKGI